MESLEDKFSESNLILLLQLINAGANVDALLRRGLQYTQIADLIFEAKEKQLLIETEEKLKITRLGLERIKNGKTLLNIKGKWISPLDELRITQLSEDEIYIPSRETIIDIYMFNFKAKSLASSGKPQE